MDAWWNALYLDRNAVVALLILGMFVLASWAWAPDPPPPHHRPPAGHVERQR